MSLSFGHDVKIAKVGCSLVYPITTCPGCGTYLERSASSALTILDPL